MSYVYYIGKVCDANGRIMRTAREPHEYEFPAGCPRVGYHFGSYGIVDTDHPHIFTDLSAALRAAEDMIAEKTAVARRRLDKLTKLKGPRLWDYDESQSLSHSPPRSQETLCLYHVK